MGVYIPGMEMPKNCEECEWHENYGNYWLVDACRFTGTMPIKNAKKGRADDCPLIEIPPHGDLIDREPFIDFIKTHWDSYDQWFVDQLEARPTIIGAEKGEE